MSEARGRPFATGNRLGRGRPKGSRNKSKSAADALLSEHGEAITRKCAVMALQGDRVALRLCMERITPPRRGAVVRILLGGTATATEVDAASQKVVRAMEHGQITPEEGETMSRMLETRVRVIEMRDWEARIEKLEEHDREPGTRRLEEIASEDSHLL